MKPSLLLAQALALAVFLTWPLAPQFWSQAIGGADTDTAKHLWTLWWMRQELWNGTPGMLTHWVNFPDGMPLYPIEPFNGLVAAILPMAPAPLSNLLAFVHVVLLGVCASWLGQEVSGSTRGAHVAGALAQGGVFTAFTLDVGVGELRQIWWIPLGLAILLRAHRTESPRAFLALALVLPAAVMACFYHGLFLAMSVAIWSAVALVEKRHLLRHYVLTAALAVAIVVPLVRGFSSSWGSAGGTDADRADLTATFSDSMYIGASLSPDELWTPRQATPDSDGRYAGGRYLGLFGLVLAGVGVAAAPRRAAPWVGILGVSVVLAMGPRLLWHGTPVAVGGKAFALPMDVLNHALAHFSEPVNFPARFLAPAGIALAALGAFASRWRLALVLVPIAIGEVLLADETPWPRAMSTLPDMRGLETDTGTGAIADFSLLIIADPATRAQAIAAQLLLQRPFASVPIERLSDWSSSGERWLRALPLARAVVAIGGGQPAPTDSDWRGSLWLLHDRGFDRILLTHRATDVDRRAAALLTPICGEPLRTAHATLWPVPEMVAADNETAAWRREQRERLELHR